MSWTEIVMQKDWFAYFPLISLTKKRNDRSTFFQPRKKKTIYLAVPIFLCHVENFIKTYFCNKSSLCTIDCWHLIMHIHSIVVKSSHFSFLVKKRRKFQILCKECEEIAKEKKNENSKVSKLELKHISLYFMAIKKPAWVRR